MNKIQELIEKCTEKGHSYSYRRGNVYETYFDKEKFAGLLVNECMKTVAARAYPETNNEESRVIHNNAIWLVYSDISDKFLGD